MRTGRDGLVTFNSCAVPSVPPAASRRPSGLNATADVMTEWPLKNWVSAGGRAGVAPVPRRGGGAAPPLARGRPAGLKATAQTGLVGAVKGPAVGAGRPGGPGRP